MNDMTGKFREVLETAKIFVILIVVVGVVVLSIASSLGFRWGWM